MQSKRTEYYIIVLKQLSWNKHIPYISIWQSPSLLITFTAILNNHVRTGPRTPHPTRTHQSHVIPYPLSYSSGRVFIPTATLLFSMLSELVHVQRSHVRHLCQRLYVVWLSQWIAHVRLLLLLLRVLLTAHRRNVVSRIHHWTTTSYLILFHHLLKEYLYINHTVVRIYF